MPMQTPMPRPGTQNPTVPYARTPMPMAGTRLYGSVAITHLREVGNPDAVAEFADLMVRLEGVRWALTIGRFGPDLMLSIRTILPRGNAGRVIQRICGPEGKAGGHGSMAGGKIEGGAQTEDTAQEWERRLTERAIKVLRAEPNGVTLVPRPPAAPIQPDPA